MEEKEKNNSIAKEKRMTFTGMERTDKISTKFNVRCKHCGVVEIPLDKKLLSELKGYVEEGKEKYHDMYAMAKKVIRGCPVCHKDIIIRAKSYVDFYDTKKANKAKRIVEKIAKDLEPDTKDTEPAKIAE